MLLLGDEFPSPCMSAGVRDVAGRGRPKPPFAMRATRKLTPPPKKKEKRKEKVKINFFTILQMRQSPVQAGERLRKKKAESWCRQRIPWRFTLTGSHPRLPSSVAALRSNSSPSRWRPARESRRGGRGGAGRLPRRHSQGPASIRLVRGLPGRPHWQGCALHALGDAGRRRASERGPARVPGPAPVLRAPSRPGLLRPPRAPGQWPTSLETRLAKTCLLAPSGPGGGAFQTPATAPVSLLVSPFGHANFCLT